MFSIVDVVACLLSLFILILVGNWKNNSARNTKQFLISDQKTGYFALTATLVMTTTNTGLLLAFSSLGYLVGYWALSLPFVFLAGLIFYTLTVAKYWRYSNKITAAHYFVDRFGKKIAFLSAAVLFVAMIGFSATYIKSLALIFQPICGTSTEILSPIITLIVLLMVARGGLQAVIRTDIISFFGIILLLAIMIYHIYHIPINNYSPIPLSEGMNTLSPAYVFSLLILTGFSYILSPSYSQKLVSAKNPITAKYAVFSAAIIIYIIYASCMVVCYMLKTKGIQINSSDTVFSEAMQLTLTNGWLGLGYGILFSIGATTLTGVWTAMVSLLTLVFDNKYKKNVILLTFICACISLGIKEFQNHIFAILRG